MGLYSIIGRKEIEEASKLKKQKEDIQMNAILNVIESGKGVGTDYTKILTELSSTINKLSKDKGI